jgi:site-specific DNA-methyltransferase (adenine-specific)
MIPFPDRKYSIIYADPPWAYRQARTHKRFGGYGSICQYPTMTEGELSVLPVSDIAEKDALLFLWVTPPKLLEQVKVMEAWGFAYKTVGFVWCKESPLGKMMAGLGSYTMPNAELVLIGKRGKGAKRVNGSVKQIIICPRKRHSEKPAEVRDRIVRLYGDVPRIELFARQRVPGWDAWGLEVPPE